MARAKTVTHIHRSAMAQVAEEGAQEEIVRKVLTRTGKSAREHRTMNLVEITFDPADNYRWGDEKGMNEDLNKGESADTYASLKGSVDSFGVEEPIGVYPVGDSHRIIFGFTRYKAAVDSKLKTIDAYVYDPNISAQERLLLQGRENSVNLKRAVSWAQEMAFLERLCEACGGMDSKVWAKAEKILGKAKSYLARMKRTWDNVPEAVRKAAQDDRIGWRAAESFYTKDGPKFNEKDARAILDAAGTEKGKEVTITQARIVAAVNKLSTADPETGKAAIAKAKAGEGVKSNRPSSKDLREHMVMLFTEARDEEGALIPEGGNTSLSEEEINELADTPEAFLCEGMGIVLGDIQSPFAEGESEELYEEQSARYRHAIILRAFTEKFFGEQETMVTVTKGSGDSQTQEQVPWLDAKGIDPEDPEKKTSNKKVLAALIADWSVKSEVEVATGKGKKAKKVEATLALKVEGLMSTLDELVAEAQK